MVVHGVVAYAVHGGATKCRFPSPLIEASPLPLPLITHSLTQPFPLSHHLLQMPNKTPTMPVMEKIDAVAIGASKAAGKEPPSPSPHPP